jgi:hypothetical protein
MMMLYVVLRCHPLKLDLPPAVIHGHPSAWGTSMSTLLVVSGANLIHPPVLVMGIGVGCPAAASTTNDDWTPDQGEGGIIILTRCCPLPFKR